MEHYIYYEVSYNGVAIEGMYSHKEKCTCDIGKDHWAGRPLD